MRRLFRFWKLVRDSAGLAVTPTMDKTMSNDDKRDLTGPHQQGSGVDRPALRIDLDPIATQKLFRTAFVCR